MALEKIERPNHMLEGGHHLKIDPKPPPTALQKARLNYFTGEISNIKYKVCNSTTIIQ